MGKIADNKLCAGRRIQQVTAVHSTVGHWAKYIQPATSWCGPAATVEALMACIHMDYGPPPRHPEVRTFRTFFTTEGNRLVR